MTRAEKVNATLSAAALVVSIAFPVLSYFYLSPQLQELRLRQPLAADVFEHQDAMGHTLEVRIANKGKLQSHDIAVVFGTNATDKTLPEFVVRPDSLLAVERFGSAFTVRINRVLGPGDDVVVYARPVKTQSRITEAFDVQVYSDAGTAIVRDSRPYRDFFGGGMSGGHGATSSWDQ